MEGIEEEETIVLTQMNLSRGLKLTRSCSFDDDCDMQKQLERAVTFLLTKLEDNITKIEKDSGIYLLMLLLYSNSLELSNPLIGRTTTLLSKLVQLDYCELFDMSKTGLFHIINRFNYNLRTKKAIKNTPVKRTWDDFLRMKYIGGENVNYGTVKIDKS